MSGSTVAVTQQDTNCCSQHRAGVTAMVDISRSSDRWAVFHWSRVGTAPNEGLGAARAQHRGEDIPEGHPDERRSTPHVQETTGADRRLIPAHRQLSCWQRAGGWKGPRGARCRVLRCGHRAAVLGYVKLT